MKNQKEVSTLVGVIVIVATVVVFFGGVLTYQYLALQKVNEMFSLSMFLPK
jgi:hypothetical protein